MISGLTRYQYGFTISLVSSSEFALLRLDEIARVLAGYSGVVCLVASFWSGLVLIRRSTEILNYTKELLSRDEEAL